MKKQTLSLLVLSSFLWIQCTSDKTTIPLSKTMELDDTYTLIWNGISAAYRYQNNAWERDSSYDYQFDVIQKRYDKTWKSIKNLHRIHPDYDGKAGKRDQTMYFELSYALQSESNVGIQIASTLGNGTGNCDREFRTSSLHFIPENTSRFMPYNRIRITQNYAYEQGILTETVLLYKEKDGKEIPFMKMEESAQIYVHQNLNTPPTRFGE